MEAATTLTAEDIEALKGEALDEALAERELAKTGTADEKRDRLREFHDLPTVESGDVAVSVAYPGDEFHTGVDDIVLTREPQTVPAGKLEAIRAAAESADTRLVEVKG